MFGHTPFYRGIDQGASWLTLKLRHYPNAIISQIVPSAIAYGDCLTAKRAQMVNQQDHAGAAKLLREVLRDELPEAQHKRYRRILAAKDAAQFGARTAPLDYADHLFSELETFARWDEDQL